MARASQFDPYRTFKFRVRFGDTTVAGITKVSALTRTVTPNELKEGGDLLAPRHNPGGVRYEDVVLEKGLTASNEFEEWANAVLQLQNDPGSVTGFKRTVYIDVFDLKGNPQDRKAQPIASYKLNRCWITRYSALPELDASSGGVGIQSVTLSHEGWERVI
ncbi:MAG TPA: phage tail protein [Candidatus Angelobacter sp.]|jgi:phage tail-like protein|nr:phage tail protein [Candidatus Angelobacter sp.]